METKHKKKIAIAFAGKLLHWHNHENHRSMPWKGEKDPYKIWLSEIILQQTRVEQGLKYYERFTSLFPDVQALANTPESQVFKAWEGLGYYNRCKNLIATARKISNELNGIFPESYHSILELKGIGPYTAAAIASFAYNLPYAVLDGNVFRVLSRIYNEDSPVDSTTGKKIFSALADLTLAKETPAKYNQAIMDFGAQICKSQPRCQNCFFQDNCQAFLTGRQQLLPVKTKKLIKKERYFNYFILKYKDEIAIRKRSFDIWKELHEFVLIETPGTTDPNQLLEELKEQTGIQQFDLLEVLTKKQNLTHQTIHFQFLILKLQTKKGIPSYKWVSQLKLGKFAFPKTLQQVVSYRSA